MQGYVKDTNDAFSAQAIAALGVCAERVPGVAEECLKSLIKLSQSKNGSLLVLHRLANAPQKSSSPSRFSFSARSSAPRTSPPPSLARHL